MSLQTKQKLRDAGLTYLSSDFAPVASTEARVLMLQGPSSLFFRSVGRELTMRGANVHRIGFSLGDKLYWDRTAGAFTKCSVPAADYPNWIAGFLTDFQPTDVVMLGDGRFYHRLALEAIRRMAQPPHVHIVEHGMIRPGWILVEPDGMGGHSRIPERFEADTPRAKPEPVDARGGSFLHYAVLDIGYHLPGMLLGWFLTPHYQRPSVVSQWEEYAGWVGKAVKSFTSARIDRLAEKVIEHLEGPVFLFPLQLEADFQIRDHGKGKTLRQHLESVLSSFADHAPADAHLVIKRHPLDNGRTPWRVLVAERAEAAGVRDRVHYLDGGNLEALLAQSEGVVTVNSTVGLQAVLAGCPCTVLGDAVYDMDGLTEQAGLDRFWSAPEKPNTQKAEAFKAFLLNEYHVPGSFDGPGASVGAKALADRILA